MGDFYYEYLYSSLPCWLTFCSYNVLTDQKSSYNKLLLTIGFILYVSAQTCSFYISALHLLLSNTPFPLPAHPLINTFLFFISEYLTLFSYSTHISGIMPCSSFTVWIFALSIENLQVQLYGSIW
jgi:hypothetical protein